MAKVVRMWRKDVGQLHDWVYTTPVVVVAVAMVAGAVVVVVAVVVVSSLELVGVAYYIARVAFVPPAVVLLAAYTVLVAMTMTVIPDAVAVAVVLVVVPAAAAAAEMDKCAIASNDRELSMQYS